MRIYRQEYRLTEAQKKWSAYVLTIAAQTIEQERDRLWELIVINPKKKGSRFPAGSADLSESSK
jgi:hypothetical protein